MKKPLVLFLTLSLALTACGTTMTESTASATTDTTVQTAPVTASEPLSVFYTDEDQTPPAIDSAVKINLAGDVVTVEGNGANVNGSTIAITTPGVYAISGALDNGQILVDSAEEGTVNLILNGATISNSSTSPIFISAADKTIITLADGTQNTVTDGATYVFASAEADEPNAAIFSKDDLVINGAGALTVNANYNNGIASKDCLRIVSGTITVNAVNDGVRGRNYISVKDASLTVNAGGDGLQSNNDEDAAKGYVLIEGGALNITAGMDGIQAETQLTINAGALNLATGGGSAVNYEFEESAKGLKAGVGVTIAGGSIMIDSADDAVHSNGSVNINGGDLQIASGDDGIHADVSLTVNNGNINILKSYEGLESVLLTINGGTIRLNASDDGVNGAGGVDGSSVNGRPGQNGFGGGAAQLIINGGYLYLDTGGDGLDVNGSISMAAGTVIVNGPVENMNGAVDYDAGFNVTGGYLLAVGSSGMAMAPDTASTQYVILYNFDAMQTAGALVHIQSSTGEDLLTFAPTKPFQSVVVSSPQITNGETYAIFTGGASTGSAVDGLYSGGAYSGGTQIASLTVSSVVTIAGAAGRGFGPGGEGIPPGGGGGMPPGGGGGMPPGSGAPPP